MTISATIEAFQAPPDAGDVGGQMAGMISRFQRSQALRTCLNTSVEAYRISIHRSTMRAAGMGSAAAQGTRNAQGPERPKTSMLVSPRGMLPRSRRRRLRRWATQRAATTSLPSEANAYDLMAPRLRRMFVVIPRATRTRPHAARRLGAHRGRVKWLIASADLSVRRVALVARHRCTIITAVWMSHGHAVSD